jgi:hypothetical protein
MKQRKRPPFTPVHFPKAISQCPLDCHCRRQFSPVFVGPQEGRPDHNSSPINPQIEIEILCRLPTHLTLRRDHGVK